MHLLKTLLLISFFVSSFVTATASYGASPSRSEAIRAISDAEKILLEHQHDGGALASATALKFIQAAKLGGALDLPVNVGSYEGSWGMAEFGSADSSFRLRGAIKRTPIALSVSKNVLDTKNSYVMVHVILDHPVEVLGYEGRELDLSLFYFHNERRVEVTFQSGNYFDEVTEKNIFRNHLELVTAFNLDSPTPQSWAQAQLKSQPNHHITVYDNDGSILPRKEPCNNLLALTTSTTKVEK